MDSISAKGNQTPIAVIFKSESNKLHIQGIAAGLLMVITFSAALVTGNSIASSVNGTSLTATAFTTDNDTTLQALAAKIADVDGVKSADVVLVAAAVTNDRVIQVALDDPKATMAMSFTVTGGASQATVAVTTTDNNIYKGMPLKLNASGLLENLGTSTYQTNCIGHSIHDRTGGEDVTLMARGHAQLNGVADGAVVPGPVKYTGMDSGTPRRPKYSSSSVDATNISGWALESAGDTEVVRVVVFN